MFEIGWGETFVVIGAAMYFIGRKDLPRAARFAGTQTGRIVGLLQGARVRADRFAAQSELRQLQNELRSGLRELDAVRSEVAVAVSSQGMVGRGLGSMVPGANREAVTPSIGPVAGRGITSNLSALSQTSTVNMSHTPVTPQLTDASILGAPVAGMISQVRELAPRSQAVAAVAEEEWAKRGIGFQSRAERGLGDANGSALLSNLYQQTLIYDQHDRAVQEQDEAIRARMVEKQKDLKNNGAGK
ncbi:zinc-RING finger domain [Fragilaria crotonensis]|nr:zinc-RING finger domain [Fragilaria crotonensis]